MSETGNNSETTPRAFDEIINSIDALHYDMGLPAGGNLEKDKVMKERDAKIKNRVFNLISVFKHFYKLPEIVILYKPTEKQKKITKLFSLLSNPNEKYIERPPIYLLTQTNKVVTGDYEPGILGIKKAEINNQTEINTNGHWDMYGTRIEIGLVRLVPELREKLEEKRHRELVEKQKIQ